MKGTGRRQLRFAGALVGSLGIALALAGCVHDVKAPPPPSSGVLPHRSLEQLEASIRANDGAFVSLSADVRVALTSPLLRGRRQLEMTGKLVLEKPRKIYLRLERTGQVCMRLVGDGNQYAVSMPVFGEVAYEGGYDEPIEYVADRIHFMPDDLADAFDLCSVLYQKVLVLRAYPRRGDIVAGTLERPVEYPATWSIDCLAGSARDGKPKVFGSLMIDRITEQPLKLEKFHLDGALRVTIWYLGMRVMRGVDGSPVRVPRELLIWYPPPLENTVIRLRLESVRINRPVPEDAFELAQQGTRQRSP